ncbi:polysaccharide lyase family 8 super-sandwich domain-containing protein [Streptomyces aculeolatus]
MSRRGLLGTALVGAGGLLLPARLASAAEDPYALLRKNWFAHLTGVPFDPDLPSMREAVAALGESAKEFAASMETGADRDKLWSDLPLGTSSAPARTSFNRVKQMALAFATPGTACTDDEDILAKAVDGLDFLMTTTYTEDLPPRGYDNWWDWQIGIPNAVEDTATLIFDHLPSDLVTTYCQRIDHFVPYETVTAGTGANLLNWCRILIVNGALRGDSDKIKDGIAALSPALDYSLVGDGMYADGSFLQHTAHVAYLLGYGATFYDMISALTRLLTGSDWPITDPDLANIHNGVDRGLVPAVWDGLGLDAMRGRNIARITSSDADTGLMVANTLLRYAEGAPGTERAARWKAIAKGWLQRTPLALADSGSVDLIARCERVLGDSGVRAVREPVGFKLYYENDRAVHRRPGWAFAIAASSARIARYEAVNDENLHGWHTGDGMTSLLLESDRKQFNDAYWNTVDATRLPGTTADTAVPADAAGANTRPTTTWAGGAVTPNAYGAGRYGAFGQELEAFGSDLSAKKSWFCLDDCVVALGAGITGTTDASIETVVENRNLHSAGTTALTIDGRRQPGRQGWSDRFSAPAWAHLDGVGGYVFLGNNSALQASRSTRTGSWLDINPYLGDATTDTRRYVTLALDHGSHPSDAGYAYLILPNATASRTAERSRAPGVTVIANSATAQGIRQDASGLTMVNFFAAGNAGPITATGPASVVAAQRKGGLKVSVADPSRTQAMVTVTLAAGLGTRFTTSSADDGITLLASDNDATTLLVEVGGAHGASRTIDLVTQPSAARPKQVLALPPTADAYIRDGDYATHNYGDTDEMEVKKSGSGTGDTGFSRRALLAFDTSNLPGKAHRAVLWLNGRANDSGGLHTRLQAFVCTGDWSESEVTWANAPATGAGLGTGWLTQGQDWVGLDVTEALTGTATAALTFAVWQPSDVPGLLTRLRSKDSGSDAPILEIVCDQNQ